MTTSYFLTLNELVHTEGELIDMLNLLFKLLTRQKNCFVKMNDTKSLMNMPNETFYKLLESESFMRIDVIRTGKLTELRNELDTCLRDFREANVREELKSDNNSRSSYLISESFDIQFTKEKGKLYFNKYLK